MCPKMMDKERTERVCELGRPSGFLHKGTRIINARFIDTQSKGNSFQRTTPFPARKCSRLAPLIRLKTSPVESDRHSRKIRACDVRRRRGVVNLAKSFPHQWICDIWIWLKNWFLHSWRTPLRRNPLRILVIYKRSHCFSGLSRFSKRHRHRFVRKTVGPGTCSSAASAD